MQMTFGSLFAGIGGFDLGLERAGMKCLWQCERDKFCNKVLAKHWPEVTRYDDITTLDASALAPVDLICGGFPCQPFSVAGKRKGAEDDRFLWPAMLKVIETVRPTWVLGENVPGLISMGLDGVLSDLENLGYGVRAFVVPACAVDAKHKRGRLWIVAHTNSIMPERGQSQRPRIWDAQDGERANSNIGRSSERHETLADTSGNRLQGRCAAGIGEQTSTGDIIREAASRGCGDIGPGRCSWTPEPNVGRVAHGVPRRVDRLRSLGNAVVPQVVEVIGRYIAQADAMADQWGSL